MSPYVETEDAGDFLDDPEYDYKEIGGQVFRRKRTSPAPPKAAPSASTATKVAKAAETGFLLFG